MHALLYMKDSSRRFLQGVEYGVIGTLAMSVVMFIGYVIGAGDLRAPLPLSIVTSIIMRASGIENLSVPLVLVAILIMFAYGALWMGLAVWSTDHMRWWKGMALGLGLWIVMMIFFLPLEGNFTFEVATAPSTWIGTLIGHALYGATGGALADERLRQRRRATA